MPQYKLDKRGILTIIDENDTSLGHSPIVSWIHKGVLVLFALTLITVIVIYGQFYYDIPGNSHLLPMLYEKKIATLHIYENMNVVLQRSDGRFYWLQPLWEKVQSRFAFYDYLFNSFSNKYAVIEDFILEKVRFLYRTLLG